MRGRLIDPLRPLPRAPGSPSWAFGGEPDPIRAHRRGIPSLTVGMQAEQAAGYSNASAAADACAPALARFVTLWRRESLHRSL